MLAKIKVIVSVVLKIFKLGRGPTLKFIIRDSKLSTECCIVLMDSGLSSGWQGQSSASSQAVCEYSV